ncbi:hypothetical protein [Bradyrhizobium guangdongense]|uniref:hypothetical protein n=1 Tax=Bradyrhizobium guangdongense TaxID=1325090 RepID=UPI0016427710|nr:hypothetical protein [Bradyrhizobium guangdongense]
MNVPDGLEAFHEAFQIGAAAHQKEWFIIHSYAATLTLWYTKPLMILVSSSL